MFYHSRSSRVRSRVVFSTCSSRTHLCYDGTLLTPFRHRSFRVYFTFAGQIVRGSSSSRPGLTYFWMSQAVLFTLYITTLFAINTHYKSMPSQLCREPVVLWEDHSLAFDVLWTWKLHAFTPHTTHTFKSDRAEWITVKNSLLLSLILMLASPPPIITPLQGHITLIPTTWCIYHPIPSSYFIRRMDILF